jgi:hypothetical protein
MWYKLKMLKYSLFFQWYLIKSKFSKKKDEEKEEFIYEE